MNSNDFSLIEKPFLEINKFALENNYFLIPLDEMIVFNKDDFFDPIHTTPKGSKKIADSIYPQLYNYCLLYTSPSPRDS